MRLRLAAGLALVLGAAGVLAQNNKAPSAVERRDAQTLANGFFNKAEACYQRHELPCALEELRKALTTERQLLAAHVLLSKVLVEGGNAAAGEGAVDRALSLGIDRSVLAPTLARALLLQGQPERLFADTRLPLAGLDDLAAYELRLLRAQARRDLGDARAALAELAEARKLDAKRVEPWLVEAEILLQQGQQAQAAVAVEQAQRLAPGSAGALFARAQLLQARGDAGTRAAFEQVLAADPTHLEARLGRAALLLQERRGAEVDAELKLLLGKHATDPRVAFLQAQRAEQLGDVTALHEALRRVADLIGAQPTAQLRYRPSLLLMAGLAHKGLGDNSRAREYLELYRERSPDRAGAAALARLYLDERDNAKAIATLEQYLRGQPADPQILALLGSAGLAAGRSAQVTQLMREALRGQDSPAFHALLGLSLAQQGQSSEAEAALKRALQKKPTEPVAVTALAELYLQTARAAQVPALLAPALKAATGREGARYQLLLGRARQALGELPAARQAFEAALAQDDGQLQAQLLLARVQAQSGDIAGAARRLEAMLAREQLPVDAALELAELAQRAGKIEAARGWLQRGLDKSVAPDRRAGLAMVEFLLRQGELPAAAEQARQLLALAPEEFALLIASARVALAQRDGPAAARLLQTAGRVARSDVPSLWLVARLQMNAGDLKTAAYTLEKALAERADLLPLRLLSVELALREGNATLATQRIEPLLKQRAGDARVHSLSGQVALARQQGAQAVAAFKRAHELAPSSESVLRLYAAQLGQLPPAQNLALLEQWLAKRPNDTVVRNAAAEGQVLFGNLAVARRHYETLLQQTQSNAVRNNLASVLLRQQDPGALAVAEQAWKLEPSNPAILDTAGWASLQAGKLDQALRLLREARLRVPGDMAVRYHLAEALRRQGRAAEALQELSPLATDTQEFHERTAAEALLVTLKAGRP